MTEKDISNDAILNILVGDLKSEESLMYVLNFLEHTTTIIRYLYWTQRLKNNHDADKKYSCGVPLE
jgi:hypothetical protein